ncbi:hypothetical protein [Sphingomonas sp. LaA6.9]|uniref:hypothetical protein n=1 Tax=Sphingomonas sp. LaA6.9 TaxID=2919914 RepID=UPI001F4FCE62|nr:hypothetical protein [Sphingomonas sp. LaA6.9]MCJ8157811.1 hypothetical protein [Sphingomonas sp. LaA6.9]
MASTEDRDYFLRREREERIAAERATHPLARNAHLDMADRYHARAAVRRTHART